MDTLRILLCDDGSGFVGASMAIASIDQQWECTTAASTDEALAALDSGSFDIAVIELGQAEVDARAVAAASRQRGSEVVSAGWEEDLANAPSETKLAIPFTMAQLTETLEGAAKPR